MLSLYEIRNDILNCVRLEDSEDMVNTETGEVFDIAAFEKLQGDFNEKALNLAKWIKNLDAERGAIYNEKKKLEAREKAIGRKIDSIKNYLDFCTKDIPKEKLPKDATTIITRRVSNAVDIDMEKFLKWEGVEDYLTYAEPKPDKTSIKNAIKSGTKIPGCMIVENQNLQIK